MYKSGMLRCLLDLNYNQGIWIADKEQVYQKEEARKIFS